MSKKTLKGTVSMSKSNDPTILQDKEIPADEIVESIQSEQSESEKPVDMTFVEPSAEDEKVIKEEVDEAADKFVERRRTIERRKTSTRRRVSDAYPTRLYLSEIEGSPLLTAEEEVYYSRKAQKGESDARDTMIECNLRLVVKIARR